MDGVVIDLSVGTTKPHGNKGRPALLLDIMNNPVFFLEFGEFFVLEATRTIHRYKVKIFPGFTTLIGYMLPVNIIIQFTSHKQPIPFLI